MTNLSDKRYSVRLDEADAQLLRLMAKADGQSWSDAIRLAIRERAERHTADFMGRLRMVRSV